MRVVIQNAETGQREEITCDYLAGCDGPQSMVRRHLGIAYSGEKPEEQSYGSGATVATHLRAPELYRIVKHNRCWQYRTVNSKVRSNLVTLDGEGEFTINTKLRNPDEKPDPKLVANLILESVGENIDIEFLGHLPWTAGHALVAGRFVSGRIALAGDAVHVFTPTGGFGMNTGVDDAVNLAWKLAAMVSGWGGPNLLPSYEIERRPIAFRNTGMAKELSRGMGKISIDDDLLHEFSGGRRVAFRSREADSRCFGRSLLQSASSWAPDTMIRRLSFRPARRHRPTTRRFIDRPPVREAGHPISFFMIAARCSIVLEPGSVCFISTVIMIPTSWKLRPARGGSR